jgi:hypothetical protein
MPTRAVNTPPRLSEAVGMVREREREGIAARTDVGREDDVGAAIQFARKATAIAARLGRVHVHGRTPQMPTLERTRHRF